MRFEDKRLCEKKKLRGKGEGELTSFLHDYNLDEGAATSTGNTPEGRYYKKTFPLSFTT